MLVKRLAAVTALAAAAVVGPLTGNASATESAASDVTPFNITYYNTYFIGNVYWYDRSVSIQGTLRGQAGSCRRMYGMAYDYAGLAKDWGNSSTVCNAAVPEILPLTVDEVGGPAWLRIRLSTDTGISLKYADCTRQGCVIYNG